MNVEKETGVTANLITAAVAAAAMPAYGLTPPQTIFCNDDYRLTELLTEAIGVTKHERRDDCCLPFFVKAGRKWDISMDNPAFVWCSPEAAAARLSLGQALYCKIPPLRLHRWTEGRLPHLFHCVMVEAMMHMSEWVTENMTIATDVCGTLLTEIRRFLHEELGLPEAKGLHDTYHGGPDLFYDFLNILRQQDKIDMRQGVVNINDIRREYERCLGIRDVSNVVTGLVNEDAVDAVVWKTGEIYLSKEMTELSHDRVNRFFCLAIVTTW
jgi:hypothetical protein